MNEKNPDEIRYRRQAFKFFEQGKSPVEILARLPRSRAWLFKWKKRFEEQGWAALDSLPKTPNQSPQSYPAAAVRLVVQTRRRLEKSTAGMVSARAIQRELRLRRLLAPVPSQTTIKRWLRAAGVLAPPGTATVAPYYPALPDAALAVTFACDWIARYFPGGAKVYAFHTLDLQTHALAQTLRADKSTEAACAHLLAACQSVGRPDFLRLDNDAAFTGLGRRPRQFGRFVRTALALGIELLFIPPGQPKRNHEVERVNGLWAGQFWDKNYFADRRALARKSPQFMTWYQSYAPPVLNGLSVAQATQQQTRDCLPPAQAAALSTELPLTAGRLHFVRQVKDDGTIEILKEHWRVSRSLRGEYVWATLDLRQQELRLYHRRSTRAQARLLCSYAYEIDEPVKPLSPELRRRPRALDMLHVI